MLTPFFPLQLSRVNGASSPQSPLSTPGRVAAVGPYIQVPSTGSCSAPGDPVKPQSLTVASGAAHGRPKPVVPTCRAGWRDEDVRFCQGPDSPRDFLPSPVAEAGCRHVRQPVPAARHKLVGAGAGPADGIEMGKMPPPVPGVGKQLPPSYSTHPSPAPVGPGPTNSLERRKEGSLPRPSAGLAGRQKPGPLPSVGSTHPPGSSQQIQQRISVPPSPTYPPAGPPAFPTGDGKPELPLTVAIRPFLADKGSRPQSPRKGPQTVNSSSIYSMYLQQATPPKNYQPAAHGASNKSVKAGTVACALPPGPGRCALLWEHAGPQPHIRATRYLGPNQSLTPHTPSEPHEVGSQLTSCWSAHPWELQLREGCDRAVHSLSCVLVPCAALPGPGGALPRPHLHLPLPSQALGQQLGGEGCLLLWAFLPSPPPQEPQGEQPDSGEGTWPWGEVLEGAGRRTGPSSTPPTVSGF
ncbi:Apoptosis-stimulating of p53 protein 1 [Myotis davidii]|uniref:Apoptosis-stimulating of p53 protein 1 n=1 Tax=Myotis davidii TaxID=225400 RepID=L5LRB6_MYODS|nr:Apoptosis-stimulating of p53 protein 1 [Myotis davidii]